MRFALGLSLAIVAAACSTGTPPQPRGDLTVSAAVSLKDAFTEIGALYKAKTGGTVTFNFGSSGMLQKQIETGAPADLFASAGQRQMDELAAKGMIAPASRRDFARNTLVMIVPVDSKLDLKTPSDLAQPGVTKIAVGNPKTVPAGQYTEQFLQHAGLAQAVGPKLILAENVRQVLDYVSRGEVDAGLVYATDAKVAGDRVRIAASIPVASHDTILYPLAVISSTKNRKAADDLAALVISREGRAILARYGFAAADEVPAR